MPVEALALVLVAAFLHALWNTLLAGSSDTQATTAAALLVGVAAFAPAAAATWRADAGVIPYAVASAVLELAYFALLALAYARAQLSLVYPLTRGLAPVLVLVASVVVLDIASQPAEVVGVLVVAAGVVLVRGLGGPLDGATLAMVGALALAIASYTLVDRYGVQHASPLAYLELVLAVPAIAYAGAIGKSRVRRALTWRGVGAGLSMVGAYGLVLAALRLASPASVAAVRESSVVIAVGLAALVLGEPVGRLRVAGAVVVVAGIALIALA